MEEGNGLDQIELTAKFGQFFVEKKKTFEAGDEAAANSNPSCYDRFFPA